MNRVVCKDQQDWVNRINFWLSERRPQSKNWKLFIPAGETPRPLYRSWQESPPEFLKDCELLQIDDVISGSKKNIFKIFFENELPKFKSQLHFIDSASQCADVAMLGLGVNGHVAFHEPFLPENFFSGCLRLESETAARLGVESGSQVVTYGVGAFLKAKSVALIVRGVAKRPILQKVLADNCQLPAAFLKKHPDLTVFTDFD